jgi:hypothetical protein
VRRLKSTLSPNKIHIFQLLQDMFYSRPIAFKTKIKKKKNAKPLLNPIFSSKTITILMMSLQMLMFPSSLFILIGIQMKSIMAQISQSQSSESQ